MPCYHPMTAWKSKDVNKSGKRSLVFKEQRGLKSTEMEVPCGQCIGCRLEKSRQWALRCVHEASLHDENCFLTLTYNPENLPGDQSLNHKHFQDFFKRLRKAFPEKTLKYYMCGEYGEEIHHNEYGGIEYKQHGRPHYHACVFGLDFDDKQLYTVRDGINLYQSPLLEKIWGKGFCTIGDVTFDSAAYVARYVMKKITGDMAEDHYTKINWETGELFKIEPEYNRMSRRPGVGKTWFEEFKGDIEKDYVTVNGIKQAPIKYYDYLFDIENPDELEERKAQRQEKAWQARKDNTLDRRYTREAIKERQIKRLTRELD